MTDKLTLRPLKEKMKVMTDIKYIVGRSNLAVTIFVPYDCPNHCPFCTSKTEYSNTANFSLTGILESVEKVASLSSVKDIVITGGEPFANLEILQKIIDKCAAFKKNLFINTTLPVKTDEEAEKIFELIYRNQNIIKGLNISRHIGFKTKLEDDRLIRAIYNGTHIKLRINSVLLNPSITKDKVKNFISCYECFINSISFRADYTKIKDQNDLRGLDYPLLNILFNMTDLEYLSSGGCLVCNNNDFKKGRIYISLHRGYEHSLVIAGNNYIINDIIIKQDGSILMDWDGSLLDVAALKQQWK